MLYNMDIIYAIFSGSLQSINGSTKFHSKMPGVVAKFILCYITGNFIYNITLVLKHDLPIYNGTVYCTHHCLLLIGSKYILE